MLQANRSGKVQSLCWLAICALLAACRQRAGEPLNGATPIHEMRSSNAVAPTRIQDAAVGANFDARADGSVPSQPQSKTDSPNEIQTRNDSAQPSVRFHGKAGRRATKGKSGIVVSVEPQATRVGVDILESGGNAVDAAVAVALALAVTHPSAGNLGGGGFWLIHRKDEPTSALDFRETAPRVLDRQRFSKMIRSGGEGADSVGVPGTIAGLFAAHSRFGVLPWRHVTLGAIRLAEQGHRVGPTEANALKRAWPALKLNPEARQLFANATHRAPAAGAWIKRASLARTLQRIRDQGRDGFYRGEVADSIVRALGDNSQISAPDLAEYEARWRTPRRFSYRGFLVETMPLPSAGGAAFSLGLNLLERFDVGKMPYGSAGRIHLLMEIQRRADFDRASLATDPDRLTPEQLRIIESHLRDGHAWDSHPINPNLATPDLGQSPSVDIVESANTTHFAVVDADRMVVSATMTLSAAFGAKIVTDTGITLNNTLASFSETGLNQPHPRQRTTSSMAPTLVFDETGLVLVLGTPGGDTISSTLVEVVSNLVDYDMPLDEAIDAPRFHQSFAPDRARYETSHALSRKVRQELQRMGHVWGDSPGKQGHANCVLLTGSALFGYADPREGGLAMSARNRGTEAH